MKRFLLIIIALMLAVSFAGCSADSLGDYKKAADKTDQIKKGQTAGEFSVEVDFNTDGMTEEQIKELNYFKNMKGSFNIAFDDDTEQGVFRNYLNFGGLGFDFDMFVNKEEVFMKLPVIGKYMRLEDMQAPMLRSQEALDIQIISRETQKGISEKWLGMLKQEDIFRGKDIVLTTPDGEVKTTEYTIKLNDSQIKSLAADSLDMLSRDEKLKENYEEYIKKNVEMMEDTSFEKLFEDVKNNMKDYTVEGFSYTAHVDIDGYIVSERIEVSLKVNDAKPATATRLSYKLDIKNWDINKDQRFEFPVLTEENTLDMEEMDKSMPFMMEDLFRNKD